MSKIKISPLTRIEGHLAIHTESEQQDSGLYRITTAKCVGEMYRGIETILKGRDPLDAQQITQRICGVCPISHGIASLMAQEMAYGIVPTPNGRLSQNLIFAANYIQSHVLHFYHLAALDFVDITAVLKYDGPSVVLTSLKNWVKNALDKNLVFPGAPFLPRYEVDQYAKEDPVNWQLIDNYVKALNIRTMAHEMAAIFGAKLPHSTALVPTGVTGEITIERILSYKSRLDRIQSFIEQSYIPDLIAAAKAFDAYWKIGQSYNNYLSYGAFRMAEQTGENIDNLFPAGVVIDGTYHKLDTNKIAEYTGYSRFSSPSNLHPFEGQTKPAPSAGYSWIKAPRYDQLAMQVGPQSRVMVAYHAPGDSWIKQDIIKTFEQLNLKPDMLNSVLGRHLARGLETKWLVRQCAKWLDEFEIGQPTAKDFVIPKTGRGFGLTEAPRGALGHWLVLDNHKIKRYQCVVPTTWNCSPKDDHEQYGPVEKALIGTLIEDPDQPLEAGRVVRSFDPCLACAVH